MQAKNVSNICLAWHCEDGMHFYYITVLISHLSIVGINRGWRDLTSAVNSKKINGINRGYSINYSISLATVGWEVFRKCCCISLGRSQNMHMDPKMILSPKNGGSLLWKIVPPGGWSLCSNFAKKCMGICLKIKLTIISTVLVRFWRSKYQIPLI